MPYAQFDLTNALASRDQGKILAVLRDMSVDDTEAVAAIDFIRKSIGYCPASRWSVELGWYRLRNSDSTSANFPLRALSDYGQMITLVPEVCIGRVHYLAHDNIERPLIQVVKALNKMREYLTQHLTGLSKQARRRALEINKSWSTWVDHGCMLDAVPFFSMISGCSLDDVFLRGCCQSNPGDALMSFAYIWASRAAGCYGPDMDSPEFDGVENDHELEQLTQALGWIVLGASVDEVMRWPVILTDQVAPKPKPQDPPTPQAPKDNPMSDRPRFKPQWQYDYKTGKLVSLEASRSYKLDTGKPGALSGYEVRCDLDICVGIYPTVEQALQEVERHANENLAVVFDRMDASAQHPTVKYRPNVTLNTDDANIKEVLEATKSLIDKLDNMNGEVVDLKELATFIFTKLGGDLADQS